MHSLQKQLIITLLSIFSLLPTLLYAQTGEIHGQVSNSQGEAIPYANVFLANSKLGSSTDLDGHFVIKGVPAGEHLLIAQFLGYERESRPLELKEGEVLHLKLQLKESDRLLQEVVVTGTMKEMSKKNSPVPVEVYTARYFENNKSPSVFESLQNVNGVRPQLNCNVCNTGDIHINGLEGPYTMIMIDGMPIVSGLSTVYGLTGIPTSLIERIEVVKGPASTLYGSEAVGGLINVITKKPGNAPLLSFDAYMSSWQEINTDLGARYALSPKVSGLMGINYFNYSHPIDNNGDNFTDLTLQDRLSVFNKLSFERSENRELNIALRYVYEDRWGGEMQWKPEFRAGDSVYGESIYTSRWEVLGNYHLPISGEKINLQLSANGHEQNSAYGSDLYLAEQRIAFAQLSWNKAIFEGHDFLLGAAYRYTYYDDNTGATYRIDSSGNKASSIQLPGVFIQDQIALNEHNTLLLGARYDYNSIHGNIFSPRVNYKWNSANERSILRLSAGNGFRVANVFTEDHAALTGAREVVFKEKLKPEESINVNLNLVQKFYTRKETFIGLDFTAFYTQFSNRIVPDYETNPNQIIYDNLKGQAISKGLSLNADVLFKSGWKVMGGVTAMDVSIEENGEKRQQLLTESFSGVWSVEYTLPQQGIRINYTGNVYGPMRLPLLGPLDERAAHSPWWSIQNIQLSKSINEHWEVYGGVKNLLNFTPAANSIARAFDPFDKKVQSDANGNVIATPDNPQALSFDPSYVYATNQGIRGFLGIKYTLR
jgi:outer membrane receptor for ferrienterochelin and colicins